jgi:hypothetical protein
LLGNSENFQNLGGAHPPFPVVATSLNFKWEDIRMIIKMLKHNRLPIAHPNNENTTKEDIMKAIECCYPNTSSSWRKNAEKRLQVLEFLAAQLQEHLFISIMD